VTFYTNQSLIAILKLKTCYFVDSCCRSILKIYVKIYFEDLLLGFKNKSSK
jgi:hypothetical protein